ncbi:hypothetical protein FHT21_002434 [Pedobacter sp. SG908]|nr:hypothetical protein [Pedobacter sp. SG908]NMN37255.1 hypothetical protein [Pedobacter sp. SG918]
MPVFKLKHSPKLNKPDKNGSSRFFIETIAVSRATDTMEYRTVRFQKSKYI